jgi:hypothetical protein
MQLEVAQSVGDVFLHGFSAGFAVALVFVGCYAMARNWRRDP